MLILAPLPPVSCDRVPTDPVLGCRFLGSEDKENFFTRGQRSRMVYEILCTTTFGREKKGEVGASVKHRLAKYRVSIRAADNMADY